MSEPFARRSQLLSLNGTGASDRELLSRDREVPGDVAHARRPPVPVPNRVAPGGSNEDDGPLAKENAPSVGRRLARYPAIGRSEPAETHALPIDPHRPRLFVPGCVDALSRKPEYPVSDE